MAREEDKFKRLVEEIFATRDDEIQCREAEDLIARCSDALLADEEVRRQYPQLWHHLGLCPDCAEVFRGVMALARDEAEGHLPQPERRPPVPDEEESQMQQTPGETVSRLFAGFSSRMAAAVTRGETGIVEPVTITFPEDGVSVTLDVAPAVSDPQRRDLYCTVTTEGDRPAQSPEGAPVWLQTAEYKTVVVEKTLDDLGDALFEGIAPGTYGLRLCLAGNKEYRIAQIEIP
jgi:hypothetical protein